MEDECTDSVSLDDIESSQDESQTQSSTVTPGSEPPTGKGWYPGRFLGLGKKVSASSSTTSTSADLDPFLSAGGGSIAQPANSNASVSADENSASLDQDRGGKNASESNDDSKSSASYWYPGKLIGVARRLSGLADPSEIDGVQQSQQQTVEEDESATEPVIENRDDIDEKSRIEEANKESMIAKTVRLIRSKYLERQLIGKIFIHRLSGIVSSSLTSEVTKDDITDYLTNMVKSEGILQHDALLRAELTGQYRRSLSTTDSILNSMERRSLSWKNCDFAHNTMISRGTVLGVKDPFVGFVGFSFTLELSATAHSLLASRRRYEASRDLAAPPSRPPFFSSSNSYSGRGQSRGIAEGGVKGGLEDVAMGEEDTPRSSFGFSFSFPGKKESGLNSKAGAGSQTTLTTPSVATPHATAKDSHADEGPTAAAEVSVAPAEVAAAVVAEAPAAAFTADTAAMVSTDTYEESNTAKTHTEI